MNPNSRTSRLLPFAWAMLVIAIVGGIVAVGLRKLDAPDSALHDGAATTLPTEPAKAVVGRDYYVLVKLVEFNPRKPNGSPWDRGAYTAPDPKVTFTWHGSRVYTLPTRQDQFIATWDLFRVNIADLVRNGGDVDIGSSINGPLVQVQPDAPLTIEVLDSDLTYDDMALKIRLALTDLHPGENDIPIPRGSGLKRLVVELVDRQTPLAQLIEMAQKR